MSATLAVRPNVQDYAAWRKIHNEPEPDGPAAASDPGITEPEWLPGG